MCSKLLAKKLQTSQCNRDKNPSFVQAIRTWCVDCSKHTNICHLRQWNKGHLAPLLTCVSWLFLFFLCPYESPNMGKGVDILKAGMLSNLPLAVSWWLIRLVQLSVFLAKGVLDLALWIYELNFEITKWLGHIWNKQTKNWHKNL